MSLKQITEITSKIVKDNCMEEWGGGGEEGVHNSFWIKWHNSRITVRYQIASTLSISYIQPNLSVFNFSEVLWHKLPKKNKIRWIRVRPTNQQTSGHDKVVKTFCYSKWWWMERRKGQMNSESKGPVQSEARSYLQSSFLPSQCLHPGVKHTI